MSKNDIWEVYNKFRGSINTSAFYDLVMFALLFKKIELSGADYYQKELSLGYISRLYGDMISKSDLCKYIETIEKNNNVSKGIVSEYFQRFIGEFNDKNEIELLRSILTTIDSIDFENVKEIENALDDFNEKISRFLGLSVGSCTTSISMARLEAELLDVEEGCEIYDPFCGNGRTIIEAGNKNNPLNIMDNNLACVVLSIINIIINGRNIAEASCGNALFSLDKKYKYIVCEPPLGMKYSDDIYDELRKSKDYISRDSIEIDRIIDCLSDDGKAVVLVPLGMLFRSGKTQMFREHLLGLGILESVICIPTGVFSWTAINTALLVINKKNKSNNVFMMDSSSLWTMQGSRERVLKDDDLALISEIVRNKKSVEGISRVVDNVMIIENDSNLTPTVYTAPFNAAKLKIKDINEMVDEQKRLEDELFAVSKEIYKLRCNE